MGYRRQKSNHDVWRDYCQNNWSIIDRTGLEPSLFKNERIFREYLTQGLLMGRESEATPLTQLSDSALEQLSKFVEGFPFDMDMLGFDAYNREYYKRLSKL